MSIKFASLVSASLSSSSTSTGIRNHITQYVFSYQLKHGIKTVIAPSCRKMSGKPKVLLTRSDFPKSALDLLKDYDLEVWTENKYMPREELLSRAAGKDALIITPGDKVNDELLDAAGSQLKVIATHTVGYDHVDFPAMKNRGIRLGYTPGVLDDAVAELVIGVMLTCTRRLFEGRDVVIKGEWPKYAGFFWMNGLGLKNSTVGIVGLGRIGLEIAKRLVPFKVKEILYTSRTEKPEAKSVNGRKVELNHLLKESDIVIVMCALTPETKHLIGEKEFNLMKRSAVIVNGARGGILDQDALVKALKSGTIGGAALDVTTPEPLPADHELLTLNNCCKSAASGYFIGCLRFSKIKFFLDLKLSD